MPRLQALLDEAREHSACQGGQEDALDKHLGVELFATQPEHLHPPASVASNLRHAYLREYR